MTQWWFLRDAATNRKTFWIRFEYRHFRSIVWGFRSMESQWDIEHIGNDWRIENIYILGFQEEYSGKQFILQTFFHEQLPGLYVTVVTYSGMISLQNKRNAVVWDDSVISLIKYSRHQTHANGMWKGSVSSTYRRLEIQHSAIVLSYYYLSLWIMLHASFPLLSPMPSHPCVHNLNQCLDSVHDSCNIPPKR